MMKVWIVTADTTRARIFRADHGGDRLEEVEDLVNPQSRFPDRDLVSDSPGRTVSGGSSRIRHAYGDGHEKRDSLRDDFARDVVSRLERHRARGELERLYLVAEPRFLGLLRAHMGKELKDCVAGEVDRSLASAEPDALRVLLPRHL